MSNNALYIEIYTKLLNSIRQGEYAENTPLPSERFLCNKYHVSRSTIRQAITLLREADIVYTVRGNGTFVKPQVFTQPLTNFYSFTDTLKRSNIIIQNKIIQYDKIFADSTMVRKTGYPANSAFHKIVRLRSAKDYPLMLETTYLPCARFLKLDLDVLSKGSLYEFLKEKYSFHADNAEETLQPVLPLPEEKKLLKIHSNTPCILLERFSFEDGALIEYTKSIVRGDKYIFHVQLNQFSDTSSL